MSNQSYKTYKPSKKLCYKDSFKIESIILKGFKLITPTYETLPIKIL